MKGPFLSQGNHLAQAYPRSVAWESSAPPSYFPVAADMALVIPARKLLSSPFSCSIRSPRLLLIFSCRCESNGHRHNLGENEWLDDTTRPSGLWDPGETERAALVTGKCPETSFQIIPGHWAPSNPHPPITHHNLVIINKLNQTEQKYRQIFLSFPYKKLLGMLNTGLVSVGIWQLFDFWEDLNDSDGQWSEGCQGVRPTLTLILGKQSARASRLGVSSSRTRGSQSVWQPAPDCINQNTYHLHPH